MATQPYTLHETRPDQGELFERKPAGKHTHLLRKRTQPADYRAKVAAALRAFAPTHQCQQANTTSLVVGGKEKQPVYCSLFRVPALRHIRELLPIER